MNTEQLKGFLTELFDSRGDEMYGKEAVTQRQHALQSAVHASRETDDPELVLAALLHDVGHILGESHLPGNLDDNLDDSHESRAYPWVRERFGDRVADPVRLHVAAKRYLCTVDPGYAEKLSPTSYKSFLDQGGPMNQSEREAFEAEPHFQEAVQLRRWDDAAKDPSASTPDLQHFLSLVDQLGHQA
jgi:phosphonate degradation associated HDIG domain protein